MTMLFTFGTGVQLSYTDAKPSIRQKDRKIETFEETTEATGTLDIEIENGDQKEIVGVIWTGSPADKPQSTPSAEIVADVLSSTGYYLKIYSSLFDQDPTRDFRATVMTKLS